MNAVEPKHGAAGELMARESAEGPAVFARTATVDHRARVAPLALDARRAFYTIARGSSDAAATVLAYEMMRETGIPTTSMPPSVFSLGAGVTLSDAAVLVISQSGASDDLVASTKGARKHGALAVAITNREGSAVEARADLTLPIGAGPELAVPATKTVIGAIAAGISLISALKPGYGERTHIAAGKMAALAGVQHPRSDALCAALLAAQHVYVIGRGAGYGAAQEVALKLKECCALHAEAYSSSEVLHGPLQLVTKPITILMLDTEEPSAAASMDTAEARFRQVGGIVHRIRPSDVDAHDLPPAVAAAVLLHLSYPIILAAALALGLNPDRPDTLAKETLTL